MLMTNAFSLCYCVAAREKFVDTPGVESLIEGNQKTTMEFLPKVSMAIFLISTTPALLDDEVEFLHATWSFADRFVFVQNVWGET